jgi:MFS family permease
MPQEEDSEAPGALGPDALATTPPVMIAARWRVVAALFVVTGCMAASVSAFGVFLPVLSETFGWSRGAISMALSINLVWGGVAAFAIGGFADRHGPRAVLVPTVLTGALGFALTSRVEALWHFYLSYGLLVGLGMSSIYILSTTTVARWFEQGRGLALAIVFSGFNLGWLVGGPVAAFLIGHWGWRAAYLGLAALISGMGVPASFCVRYPAAARIVSGGLPAEADGPGTSMRASFRHALQDRRLWYLVAAWLLLGLVFMMVSVHSVAYARDRGLPLEQASLALTAFGIGAAVGRLVAGVAADRLGTAVTMPGCVVAQGVALLVLLAAPPSWALIPVLIVFGVGASGADNTFAKAVPEVFGLGALASIMSVVGLGWRCGAALGPAAAGFLYDATRSYTPAFGAGLLALAAGLALFALGSTARAGAR